MCNQRMCDYYLPALVDAPNTTKEQLIDCVTTSWGWGRGVAIPPATVSLTPVLLVFAATIVALPLFAMAGRVLAQFTAAVARKYRIARALRHLPGPPSLPLIGNLHQLGQNMTRLHWFKAEMTQTYGPTYATRVDILMDGSIVTSCPKNIEYILQTRSDNFVKPALLHDTCKEVMGQSIFAINPDSHLWALQRKMMSSMFSVNSFRKYMRSVFREHTLQTVADIHAAAAKGTTLNMELVLLTLTTNISFHIGFGRHVPAHMNSPHFHDLFRDASSITANRFTKPWYKWFGAVMPSEQRMKHVMAEIDGMFYDVIAARQAEARRTTTTTDVTDATTMRSAAQVDVLTQLVARQSRGETAITDTFLRDMMMTVMLAGRETVASGLLWVVYMIARHPAVQAKVFAEVDAIDATDYDSVAGLSYLEAVMKESWRLFPPTALELKSAVHDDVLPDGTFVPAGVNVEFSPFVMGRDASRWPRADEFLPERWLDPAFKMPTDYEYPVFNAGKRKCVGQRIALLQIKYILTMLYQRFNFDLTEPEKAPQLTLGIALFAKDGIHVTPTLRQRPVAHDAAPTRARATSAA
ncbi:Aste57867_10103 [Aphanomyces stellatus]|uniref:Aste57867_10103 protein n=1 Tax=Aphanomyces stellatus TaxID=120398 RepID=A0A485KQ65_9STRA|nr:hypothetical protein As57867_010064 [Aphanomyces stellatus]VFT86979.1 Aste57867_10103 [Aphanomyces stellatus]